MERGIALLLPAMLAGENCCIRKYFSHKSEVAMLVSLAGKKFDTGNHQCDSAREQQHPQEGETLLYVNSPKCCH